MPVHAIARHIRCDGAFNLRDLGGYATRSGATVRWHTLYRADGLHRIPRASTQGVTELGLRTILDLRTTDEVDAGAFSAEGIEVIHLPILRRTWGTPDTIDVDPVSFLSDHYLQMLEEGAGGIAAAFMVLASRARLPAAFHCSAGKDRTGVLAALVLSALGVPDETVAADYHLSAAAVERLVAWLRVSERATSEEMPRQPKPLLTCPPEAMLRFLDALRARFGSVDGYLADIGVAPEVLVELRRSLLAPA